MLKRKCILLLCILLAVFPVVLLAQGKQEESNQKTTIRFSWWGGESRHQKTLEAIDVYMENNPHVIIEAEYSGFSGYYQKLVTQLVAGTAPDVFQSDQGWTTEFHLRGDVFEDLSAHPAISTSRFNQQLLKDYCLVDNQLAVLPLGFNGTVFVYNKTLLSPYLQGKDMNQLTWQEFIELGQRLHKDNPDAYLTTNITDAYVRFILKAIMEQTSNAISIQDDYTLGFSKQEMTDAFTLFRELFASGAAQPYAESAIYKDNLQDNPKWRNGLIGGSFIFFSNIDRETAGLPYEFDVARIPQLAGARTSGQETGPSLMLAMNKASRNKDESARFIDWFLNSPEAAAILATERGVPANEDSLNVLKDKEMLSPLMEKAVDISNATMGFKNGALEMNASIHAIFVEKMEKVIYDRTTPAEAADELIRDVTKRLDEMKQE